MTSFEGEELHCFLAAHPPFDALSDERLAELSATAEVESYGSGELALGDVQVAVIASRLAEPAFASGPGARFLAGQNLTTATWPADHRSAGSVCGRLLRRRPLRPGHRRPVAPSRPVAPPCAGRGTAADRDQRLVGVITPRDFAVSPTTAGASVHEQIHRAGSVEESQRRCRRVAPMLADPLSPADWLRAR